MNTPLDEALAEPDDAALCGRIFELILRHHGDDVVAAELPEAERVVLLVCNVSAIISNGGFRYLFEEDIDGDPSYARCAEAYQIIGCEVAAQAFRETLALFPNGRPPREAGKRIRHYLTGIKDWPTPQDKLFFTTDKDRDRCLAAYIRTHARAYRHLDGPPKPRLESPQEDDARDSTRQDEAEMPLASLPHWKRVAFAARCARRVQPLFEKYWPKAPAKYANAVRQAIALAEQSAANGAPAAGLHGVVVDAAVTVGAGLSCLSNHPEADDEARPKNAHEGGIASFAAKAAQKAAEAAEASPEKSAEPAFQAWMFAQQAAGSADDDHLVRTLQQVLAQVQPAVAEAPLEPSAEDAALYERGRYLFLLFTLPEALRMLLRIGTDLAGLGEFGWWRSLLFPCGALVGAYYLWKAERWLTWLLPLAMVASGGVNLVLFVARAARTFPKVPAERAGLMFQMFALPLAALLVLILFELIGGLVFLLSPSVRAFFRMQREAEEETF